ncbi:MAG: hypothetical protein SF182_25270 [Deltaproteobacteria bacterium]|nr:hypothetical protein [Deltaproteobacteria bacterium]
MSLGERSRIMRTARIRCTEAAAALALLLSLAATAAPAGTTPRGVVGGALRATAAAPAATGVFAENVTTSQSGTRQQIRGALMVQANGLAPRSKYRVKVSGVPIGTLTTGRAGNGRVRFLPKARGTNQALSIDPRGRQISVSTTDGEDVLEGEVDDPTTPGGIRCCLTTPDEQGCDSLLEAECAALGGTSMGAGSCEPDPCPGQEDDEDGSADGETNDDGGAPDGEHAD